MDCRRTPCLLCGPVGAGWRSRTMAERLLPARLGRHAGRITGAPSDGYGVRRGATGVEAWQQAGICRRGPRGPAGTTGGGCGKHLNVARRAWTVAERPVSYAARRARGTVAGIESGSWRLASSAAGLSAGRQGTSGGGAAGRWMWMAAGQPGGGCGKHLSAKRKTRDGDQWWNRRMPVNAMAMPYRSHAAITSASRTEPPGSAT